MSRLRQVVLIDDNETTNFLNKRLLDKLRVADEVVVFTDAAAGYRYLWGEGRTERLPDAPELVFLDLHMPGMTGLEFLELYERLPSEAKARTRLAVLTTSMLPVDRARVAQYQNVEYLVKPLSREKLERLLAAYHPHVRVVVN